MIRPVEKEDIEKCVALIRDSFFTVAQEYGFTEENAPRFTAFATTQEKLSRQLAEGRPMYAFVNQENKIIGYYSLCLQDNCEAELNNLCVLPGCRHMKVGESLFCHALKKAAEAGCSKINFGIGEENKKLRAWYEKLGAKHLGTEKFDFFPFTCGYMEKEVSNINQGKLRNMVSIYITNKDKMLLLYRVGSKVVQPSWCGIGGHFEKDELNDAKAALLRELKEEIGLEESGLRNLELRYITLRIKGGEVRQNYYFFADLSPDAVVQEECDEGILEWVELGDVMQRFMPFTAEYVVKHYLTEGRLNHDLYSGVAVENGVIFTKLEEF